MNRISEAVAIGGNEARISKNFEIILPYGDGVMVGETEIPFSAGQVIIVPPRFNYTLGCGGGLRVTVEQALLPHKSVCVIDDDKSGGIAHAMRQAELYFRSDHPKRQSILSALGALVVSYVTAFTPDTQLSPVVVAVRNDISRHLSDCTFSLEDSIRKMPLNYDYVRKLFKKELGLTPHEYLIQSRMELARDLISSGISNQYSSYTVSQIAEASGFSEPLYFSRVFKKYFGVSPSEYHEK